MARPPPRAAFQVYANLIDSLLAHHQLIATTSRYASAMSVQHDSREFARRLTAKGSATDPNYAAKLISLMDQSNRYQFDV